ncbi:hypothetical protein FRC12_019257 [Ceratobasidium sp. 428]|nr:hypothetical protein FRC12_019257 [Ceratobasidium sp. 428]
MTYSSSINVIELSSSNDNMSSRSNYSIQIEYSAGTSNTNPTRARYCKKWVATMCNKRRSTRPQNNKNIYDSEDKVEDLIQSGTEADPTEGSDTKTERSTPQLRGKTVHDSSLPSNHSSRRSSVYAPVLESGNSTSVTLVNQIEPSAPSGPLTLQTTYSFHMEPAERRTPMPGDEWE